MVDFEKIVNHPEKKEIISKLVSGETPKVVSKYLKDKYSKSDETHLRIPATVLKEFLDTYANHHGYIKNIIKKTSDSKLEKKIADSLLDNRTWRIRLEETAEKEINYIDKLDSILTILETRAEQIFDLIQEDPENTRGCDYIFTKYMELLMLALEKADKIRNDKPDVKIEHNYTIQMVEQQAVVFQQAIRRVLERMNPEFSSYFLDVLNEELKNVDTQELVPQLTPKQIEKEKESLDKLHLNVQEFDQKFSPEEVENEAQ